MIGLPRRIWVRARWRTVRGGEWFEMWIGSPGRKPSGLRDHQSAHSRTVPKLCFAACKDS